MAFVCQPRKVLEKGKEGGQKEQGRGRTVSQGRRNHLVFSDELNVFRLQTQSRAQSMREMGVH